MRELVPSECAHSNLSYGVWDRDLREPVPSECALSNLSYGVRDRDLRELAPLECVLFNPSYGVWDGDLLWARAVVVDVIQEDASTYRKAIRRGWSAFIALSQSGVQKCKGGERKEVQ